MTEYTSDDFTPYDNGVHDCVLVGDWINDDLCAILVIGYTPSLAHDTYSDVSSFEISDGDYDAQNLANKTLTRSGDTTTVKADPVEFGEEVDIEAGHVIIVQSTAGGLSAGDKLFGYMKLNTDNPTVESIAGEFTVNWSGAGDDELVTIGRV